MILYKKPAIAPACNCGKNIHLKTISYDISPHWTIDSILQIALLVQSDRPFPTAVVPSLSNHGDGRGYFAMRSRLIDGGRHLFQRP